MERSPVSASSQTEKLDAPRASDMLSSLTLTLLPLLSKTARTDSTLMDALSASTSPLDALVEVTVEVVVAVSVEAVVVVSVTVEAVEAALEEAVVVASVEAVEVVLVEVAEAVSVAKRPTLIEKKL